MRFSTPSLGGQGESFRYLRRHGWQLSVGYRRLPADDWFVGAQISPPPGGEPLNFEIHTVDLNATFAVTERFNLTLTVPFISGKLSAKVWPDRSEEHTSELQSQSNLVCRLLLEKKKKKQQK